MYIPSYSKPNSKSLWIPSKGHGRNPFLKKSKAKNLLKKRSGHGMI
jgi:hypothetical protein